MANFYKDNPDLQYYLDKGIDWESIVYVSEGGFRAEDGVKSTAEAMELYREMVEMLGEFAADELVPSAAAIDHQGVRLENGEVVFPRELDEIFKKIKGLDLHGLCMPRELGGMNAPVLLYFLSGELFARADVSIMTHHSFHGGIALALLVLSIVEGTTVADVASGTIISTRFHKEIEEIIRGDAWGCMDITEPDAGSDMAAIRTVGEQDEDGNWYVSGQKIFITSGHGKYHFVIARTEKPRADAADDPMSGLGGLSMFMVPAYKDEGGKRIRLATVDRVEDKLGHHGSATCAISFDRTPAHLVGKRGEGFRYMLYLMNTARVGVGFECIGLCENAYRMAKEYAAGRPSMGKTIDRHELIADYLDEMEVDLYGLRALAMYAAFHEEMAQKLDIYRRLGAASDLDSARRSEMHKTSSRRVTPLLKYLGAEKAVEMARRCLQIHGGNGYMKEYSAERLMRDALVMPIYEGTSQIQALMAMKDTLGAILKNPQEFVKRLAQTRWRALSARDPLERRVARIQQLSLSAQQHLMTRTATDKLRGLTGRPLPEWPREFKSWDPKRDFSYALLHAERLIRLLTDEAVAEILLEQVRKHPERREILSRYLDRAEPRCRFLYDEITTTGQRLLAKLGFKEESSQAAG